MLDSFFSNRRWIGFGVTLGLLVTGGRGRAQSRAVITPPEPITSVKAPYPQAALEKKIEGTVTILATVDVDGVVKAVEIVESSGDSSLDQASLAAALGWRFRPALQDGKPIESQVRVPFHFHLVEHSPDEHTSGPPIPSPAPPDASVAPDAGVAPTEPVAPETPAASRGHYESKVTGKEAASRGASDYHVDVEKLSLVPRQNAADFLKLVPGILLTNAGGEGHAEQIFLRGFDAREAQDIEVTVDGVPVNESGNLHGNGYADTHFIIPELVESLRVIEGPLDPRQGNYAVAGSAEYHLGLRQRGMTAKFSVGSFGSYRLLLSYAPVKGAPGTFVAAELYQTQGFGQNRDGQRGTVMAQYEGKTGVHNYRITATAYIAAFHAAGILRDDDYRSGRVGFYDSYDVSQKAALRQGEDASRYSVAGELESHLDKFVIKNQLFGIARPLRLRENFTGFLLDVQTPLQSPHPQRGDLLDINVMEWTVGARGSMRLRGLVLKQMQELELGYFARGDFVSSSQQRIENATGHPYQTDVDLDSKLGDIGLYLDANLRFLRWLALRGGVRGDLFTYDVNNRCAVKSIANPSPTNPPGDTSCYDQQTFGAHREPNQRASTASLAVMPRGSLVVGPFWGLSASLSAGQGVRSIDPQYVSQDARTQFASVTAYEGGVSFSQRFLDRFDLSLRSVAFGTLVDRELIFSQSSGRNVLCGGSKRIGSASSARFTGPFFDLNANLTYVKATFENDQVCSDQTIQQQAGTLVPYVPDLVFRADGALFGELPWWKARLRNHAIRAALGAGVTYVGPRPLPYGTRSDTIATVDASATIGWWWVDFAVTAHNLIDTRYRLGEYNFASDFRSQSFPTLVPVRHFTAGAPRTVFFSITLNYGGNG